MKPPFASSGLSFVLQDENDSTQLTEAEKSVWAIGGNLLT